MIASKVQQLVVAADGNGRELRKERFAWTETAAALGGNATYTGAWIDSEGTGFIYDDGIFQGYAGPQEVNVVGADVYTDQAGTLYLDQSDDQTANTTNSTSVVVTAATKTPMPMTPITQRYFRWRYINGAIPQTTLGLRATAQKDESVTATMVGSSALQGALAAVTTPGTRVQLPSIACSEVTLIARKGNTGSIYVGGSNVSSTVFGAELLAKDSITLKVSNANLIYLDASVAGEGVSYVAL